MTQVNIFDRALKVLARNYPHRFLELALPGASLEIIGTLENVELALPEQRVDFVHRVLDGDEEKVLHLEFQAQHEARLPRRLFEYSALLTRQLGVPVITVVVYLRPRQGQLPAAYEVTAGGKVVNRYEYLAVKLWEHADEIAAGRWPELAPLLVTMVEPDESVLTRERELILREADEEKRADLLACAVTLAARYFDKDFLWRFFREEVEMFRETEFLEELFAEKLEKAREESRQRGLQQGLEQGTRQTRITDIQRILRWRFGSVPARLIAQLETLTAAQLDPLVDEALKAPDLGAFRARVEELLEES